ncbi:hypothetical protein [Streptomyces sp. NPDC003943]
MAVKKTSSHSLRPARGIDSPDSDSLVEELDVECAWGTAVPYFRVSMNAGTTANRP